MNYTMLFKIIVSNNYVKIFHMDEQITCAHIISLFTAHYWCFAGVNIDKNAIWKDLVQKREKIYKPFNEVKTMYIEWLPWMPSLKRNSIYIIYMNEILKSRTTTWPYNKKTFAKIDCQYVDIIPRCVLQVRDHTVLPHKFYCFTATALIMVT